MAHKELQINTEEMIVGCVRLPHISRDVLLKEVRESGLLKAETILNAMEKRNRMLKEEENKKQKQTLSTVK
uniref:BTB domain-containing protein n=1 Tax=Haemonchus contortus TaxID=6289 RepID=A0A912MW94_HAECO